MAILWGESQLSPWNEIICFTAIICRKQTLVVLFAFEKPQPDPFLPKRKGRPDFL